MAGYDKIAECCERWLEVGLDRYMLHQESRPDNNALRQWRLLPPGRMGIEVLNQRDVSYSKAAYSSRSFPSKLLTILP
jgi:hypothetical protein